MPLVKGLKTKKCAKYLLKKGWESINRQGTHETFCKETDGEVKFCQIIWNNKIVYPKNAHILIKTSGISKKEWEENCK